MAAMTQLGSKSVHRFGGFTLDVRRRSLERDGQEVSLTPKEFQTLLLLVEAAGNAVQRETLMSAVWPDTIVGDTSLARNISSLRRQLGADSIEVVPKYGYRFALPVSYTAPSVPNTNHTGSDSVNGLTNGYAAVGGPIAGPSTSEVEDQPAARAGEGTGTDGGRGDADSRRHANRRASVAAVIVGLVLCIGGFIVWEFKKVKETAPTWRDPQTGLVWARRDNGKDVDRQQAIDYCRNLELGGRKDWRLPGDLQQVVSSCEQVRQSACAEQPVAVLLEPPISDFDEAELQLDQRKDVLDRRARSGLFAVLVADRGAAHKLGAVWAMGSVHSLRRALPDDLRLALISLIAQTSVSSPCSRSPSIRLSDTLAAVASTE
jgi:DNA-binding winged helix-turn-helix (wHTH) protein